MPLISINMFPGRDEATKKALAEKLKAAMLEVLPVDQKAVSVAIQDIPREEFAEKTAFIPEDSYFILHGEAVK